MATTDRYTLKQSPPVTITGHNEATADLQLQLSPEADSGNLSGSVRRPDGTPIPFATVKLFTSVERPFEHTNSNPAGQFIFPRIPVSSYLISASEPGFLTQVRIPVTIIKNRTTTVTITMQPDPDATKNALFGLIRTPPLMNLWQTQLWSCLE